MPAKDQPANPTESTASEGRVSSTGEVHARAISDDRPSPNVNPGIEPAPSMKEYGTADAKSDKKTTSTDKKELPPEAKEKMNKFSETMRQLGVRKSESQSTSPSVTPSKNNEPTKER
jgi:hypothetical protein